MTARILIVTGTSTEVGKTIATAALAAKHGAEGERVVVVKPVQTGLAPGEEGDADVVRRLAGVDTQEWVRLPDPLAPDTAARRAGMTIPTVAQHAVRIRELAGEYDVVIVEGAGGLLVRLDLEGDTLIELADEILRTDDVEFYVVCAAGLGTLNHTALTITTLEQHVLDVAGLIVGSWPTEPGLAEQCNLEDLPRVTHVPIVAVIPEQVAVLADFDQRAPGWFSPRAG